MLMTTVPRDPAPMPMPTAGSVLAAPPLRLHRAGDRDRPQVEEFIAGVFARRFGATVTGFAPVLVTLRDATDGAIVAAAGYRAAAGAPLFLESYLGAPVESVLARHVHAGPARREVVEIGHLSGVRAGAGRQLMVRLGEHLAHQGFRWIVCTLTQELRHLLPRLGITPLALAKADAGALEGDAAAWGSYYEHDPVVLAGDLAPALRRHRHRLASGKEAA
ncbi:MAG TPA: thermostable hemolysin [Ramlibacter sp.]